MLQFLMWEDLVYGEERASESGKACSDVDWGWSWEPARVPSLFPPSVLCHRVTEMPQVRV